MIARRTRVLAVSAGLCLAAPLLAASPASPAAAATPIAITIDAGSLGPVIDPAVYGASFPSNDFLDAARPGLARWGGNATSRYNYLTDNTNRGSDWYFENTTWGPAPTSSSSLQDFVASATTHGADSAVAIPSLGWVAKDALSCGFPRSTYPTQNAFDTYRSECGDGQSSPGTQLTTFLDPSTTSMPFGSIDQTAMVDSTSATASAMGGARTPIYLIDNEPSLWNVTHHDVVPAPVSGSDLFTRSTAAAGAIKAGDPNALVAGPGDWGWCAYFYFPQDNCADGADKAANGNLDLVPAYLKAFADHDAAAGKRTLDVLDEHYYPQEAGVFSLDGSAGGTTVQRQRLAATRALWDPTFTDTSWIASTAHPVVQLIPRLKQWVAQYYPGTAIGIGEYSFGATDTMNGALAQADALGILGREGVRYAALWGPPATATSPTTYAFRMFRNLDGNGAGFGTRSVHAGSTDEGTVSAYAATRDDGTLTVVLVNKSLADDGTYLPSDITLGLAGFLAPPKATRWSLTTIDATSTSTVPSLTSSTMDVSLTGPTALTLPPASITTLVLPKRPTISLTASRTSVVYPVSTTLSARLLAAGSPVTGAAVRLYSRPAGTRAWTAVTTVSTDASGYARWTLRPSSTTEYAAIDVRAPSATVAPSPWSAVVRVATARAVSIAASATSVRLGATVRFTGKVSPAGAAHKLVLQRRVGTVWKTVATTYTKAYTSSASTWTVSLRQSVRGTQYYRAVVAGDALHLAGTSATRTVKVS